MTSRNTLQVAGDNDSPRTDAHSGAADGSGLLPRLVPELEALTREITQRQSMEGVAAAPVEGIGVALCTLEGRFIEVNDALVSLSGYAPAEIVGRTGPEVGLWTNPEEMLRCIRQRGAVDEFVLPYRTRDGRTRRMLLAARLLSVNGRGCILAVGVDVTDRTGFAYEATL